MSSVPWLPWQAEGYWVKNAKGWWVQAEVPLERLEPRMRARRPQGCDGSHPHGHVEEAGAETAEDSAAMSHLAATHLVCGICAHQGTVKECDGCYLRVCRRCDCQAHDRCRFCEDCCVRLYDSPSTSSSEEGAILTRRQDARALGSLPTLGGSRCVGQLRQRCLAGSRVFFPWETRPILRCCHYPRALLGMQEWLIADLRRYRLQLAAREESGGGIMINPTTGHNYISRLHGLAGAVVADRLALAPYPG